MIASNADASTVSSVKHATEECRSLTQSVLDVSVRKRATKAFLSTLEALALITSLRGDDVADPGRGHEDLGTVGGNLLACLADCRRYAEKLQARASLKRGHPMPAELIEMRDIAWQLQYHACCLLAQDSSPQGGPAPRQHRTQQQLQWLLANGRHEDMQSAAAAIARVAAALGPREEHLVAALTDATAILDEEVHACMHIGSVGQSSSGHGSPIQPDAAGSGGSAVASGGGVYHLDGASGACAADRTRDLIEDLDVRVLRSAARPSDDSESPPSAQESGPWSDRRSGGSRTGAGGAGAGGTPPSAAAIASGNAPAAAASLTAALKSAPAGPPLVASSAPHGEISSRGDVAEPLLPEAQVATPAAGTAREPRGSEPLGRSAATAQHQATQMSACVVCAILLVPALLLGGVFLITTVGPTLLHSCAVRSQYWDARAQEVAAEAFVAVNATMQTLEMQECDHTWDYDRGNCWPFGEVQAEGGKWLEGAYTYTWSSITYGSHRLASATDRGHVSQYDALKRALNSGATVAAWVDPDNPGVSVLDRTHYVLPAGPFENASSFCDRAIYAGNVLKYCALAAVMTGCHLPCWGARSRQ